MGFWNLFGKRTEGATQRIEPVVERAAPLKRKASQPSDTVELELADEKPVRVDTKGKFDPYNSGAFDRRGNWDKMRLK